MPTAVETRLRAKTISPSLTVDDLQKSIPFFEGLGFGIEERWEEEGKLLGVILRAGDGVLHLSQDDWKKGRNRQKGVGTRIFINTTQNVDQIAADAKKAGVTLDSEPQDVEWGGRAFEVTEPSGFKITVYSEPEKKA
jgi:uncharacterized glyoxalase superfamily protein PhnB